MNCLSRSPAVYVMAAVMLSGCSTIVQSEGNSAEQLVTTSDSMGIALPAGFAIEQVAAVPNARFMVWGDDGTLFVSTMTRKEVYAVTGVLSGAAEVSIVGSGLRIPNGVAFHNGDLYVAEPGRLLRFRAIESALAAPPEPEVLAEDLPVRKQHVWKHLSFGPDDKLYMSVGSPCNVCNEPEFGLILRMNADGSEREVYARGIRNSVGFDWHPETDELWFTDNNRDMMGDDIPPGELNRVTEAGAHYGFPFCHGAAVAETEPEFAALGSCADSRPPVQELGAHVAPLGVEFYDGEMFPEQYRNQAFIAEHGSWNRTEKIGYRVTLVRLNAAGESQGYEVFASGWLDGEQVLGRPVDVLTAADGSLLVSDDRAGAIYRISYTGG